MLSNHKSTEQCKLGTRQCPLRHAHCSMWFYFSASLVWNLKVWHFQLNLLSWIGPVEPPRSLHYSSCCCFHQTSRNQSCLGAHVVYYRAMEIHHHFLSGLFQRSPHNLLFPKLKSPSLRERSWRDCLVLHPSSSTGKLAPALLSIHQNSSKHTGKGHHWLWELLVSLQRSNSVEDGQKLEEEV